MTNDRMVANEILYAQASEEYSTHGCQRSSKSRPVTLFEK